MLDFQALDEHRVAIQPEPAETSSRSDYFGNPVTQIMLAAPHASLTVRAESRVRIAARAAPKAAGAWEAVRERLRGPGALLEPMQFLYESPHVECFRDLAVYAEPSYGKGRDAGCGVDLTRRIHADFTFDPKATSVSTRCAKCSPSAAAYARLRARDRLPAHARLAALRERLHPPRHRRASRARSAPTPRTPASAWCGTAGWVDLDPTNNVLVGDEHITLAWGRDFGDVTPMRGVILGGGEQELEVRVTVTPLAG